MFATDPVMLGKSVANCKADFKTSQVFFEKCHFSVTMFRGR